MADTTEQGTDKKHHAGRPLLFSSPDELLERAQEYFNKTPQEEWIITGVAVHLNTSRETLINYQKRDEFFDAVKKIKDMVEMAYEKSLRKRGGSGDIFGLKNFGWKDKTETDITTGGEQIQPTTLPDELVAGFSDWLSKSTKQ